MKKYEISLKTIKSKNDNDCWALAMSRFTNKPYEEIYELFKGLKSKDGALYTNHIVGYFSTRDDDYNVLETKLNLDLALQVYNNKYGILLLMKDKENEGHATYIKNDTIYDTITFDMLWWFIKQYKVEHVITKRMEYK